MARHQLGRKLTDGGVKSLVAFLESLTGTLPEGAGTPQKLPPSGKDTPKPAPGWRRRGSAYSRYTRTPLSVYTGTNGKSTGTVAQYFLKSSRCP